MVNMSAKFDKEICNGLVSIVFTRSTHGRTEPRTHGRTEPQQRYYIPTATRCAGIKNNCPKTASYKIYLCKTHWRILMLECCLQHTIKAMFDKAENFNQQPNDSAYVKIRFMNSIWNRCIGLERYRYPLKLIQERLQWHSARWKNLAWRRWWRWRAPYSET